MADDAALYGIIVGFLDIRQSLAQLFRGNVAQNDGHSAGAKPLRYAAAHHTGADHRRVRDFFRGSFCTPFLVLLRQEKVADQILRRIALAQLNNRFQLRC